MATEQQEKATGAGTAKRELNDLMREALRATADDHPIAFFCECDTERCYQAVWLTCSEYDDARSDPSWAAVAERHGAGG